MPALSLVIVKLEAGLRAEKIVVNEFSHFKVQSSRMSGGVNVSLEKDEVVLMSGVSADVYCFGCGLIGGI